MSQNEATGLQQRAHRRHVPRSLLRRIVGWCMIVFALLGFVFPILPGFPFLVPGILLLGPHDPTLRRCALMIRMVLRRWSQMQQPHLRWSGKWSREQYRRTRHAFRMHLHQYQCGDSGWKTHTTLLAAVLTVLAMSAGLMLLIWHTIL